LNTVSPTVTVSGIETQVMYNLGGRTTIGTVNLRVLQNQTEEEPYPLKKECGQYEPLAGNSAQTEASLKIGEGKTHLS